LQDFLLRRKPQKDLTGTEETLSFMDRNGWVAQSAEQWTENPRVGGSIPPPATPLFSEVKYERKRIFL
jgi:hypothetical protein